MSALSDALNEANVHRWSSRDLARRSGNQVSHTQLAKYLKPDHPTPTDAVLAAFAEIFPTLTVPKLRELAGLPRGEEDPYVPPPEGARLSVRQRKAIDELIRSMATGVSGSLFEARLRAEADALGIDFGRYLVKYELDFFRARDARIEEVRPEVQRLLRAAGGDVNQAAMLGLNEPDIDAFVVKLLLDVQLVVGKGEPVATAEAARLGAARLRAVKKQQDESAEQPDPEGPEGGA